LGNDAGLALLAPADQVDLTGQFGQRVQNQEFTTKPADQVVEKIPVKASYLDAEGNTVNENYTLYPNLDAQGNTLLPDTLFSWKNGILTAGLLPPEGAWQQGLFVSPVEKLFMQFVPTGSWQKLSSSDNNSSQSSAQAGGVLRGAYQALPNFAVGGGFIGSQAWSQTSLGDQSTQVYGGEAGLAYRWPEIFTQEDHLDLGLALKGSVLTASPLDQFTERSRPATAALHGVYWYKSVMDVSLQLGFNYEDRFLSGSGPELLTYSLRNPDYIVNFRVRLPMVREDDLRFGVTFNNTGVGNIYPTGTLSQLDLATLKMQPDILTASSGIGIGAGVVPDEGSIIALQYSLGSSKSRDQGSRAILANTGYSAFTFSSQLRIMPGLFLRAAFVDKNLRSESLHYRAAELTTYKTDGTINIAYRTDAYLVSKITYTRSFRLGVGIENGPWQLSLSAEIDNITYSPDGWNIPEKPADLTQVNRDNDSQIKGMASLLWTF
jgi:hypothetical protein